MKIVLFDLKGASNVPTLEFYGKKLFLRFKYTVFKKK